MMKNKAVAYVDGSYNKKEDLCGWGVVFLYEDEPRNISVDAAGGSIGMLRARSTQRCLP